MKAHADRSGERQPEIAPVDVETVIDDSRHFALGPVREESERYRAKQQTHIQQGKKDNQSDAKKGKNLERQPSPGAENGSPGTCRLTHCRMRVPLERFQKR